MYIKYWYYSRLRTLVLLWRYSSTHSLPSAVCAVSDQNHAWTDLTWEGSSGYKLDRSRSGRGALWERCHFIPGIRPRFSGCPARRLIIIRFAVSSFCFFYAIVRIYRHVKFRLFCPSLEQRALCEPTMGRSSLKVHYSEESDYTIVSIYIKFCHESVILTFTYQLLPLIYWEYKLKVYKHRKLGLLHKV